MTRSATLERGSFHDESTNSGTQPTDMSVIHAAATRVRSHLPIDLDDENLTLRLTRAAI